MAVKTLTNVTRGMSGSLKTWQGEYTHEDSTTNEIETALTHISHWRIANKNGTDIQSTATVSGGTITFVGAELLDEAELIVYAEGW